MNTSNTIVEQTPVIYLDHPVVGMTSPEFQEFARAVIKAIARATKKSVKAVVGGVVRAFRYLDRKWIEAAEMDRRAHAIHNERYAHNFHYLRCLI